MGVLGLVHRCFYLSGEFRYFLFGFLLFFFFLAGGLSKDIECEGVILTRSAAMILLR